MEFINKLIAILFSILILLNGMYYRRKIGTWLSPVCIFSLFWFLYTFIPLIFLINEPINSLSIIYIFFCVFLFSLPSLLFKWKNIFSIRYSNIDSEFLFDSKFFRAIVIGCIFIAVTGDIYQVISQGVSLTDILFNTLVVGSELAMKRYNKEIELSIFGSIGTFCSYLSLILAGLLFGSTKSKAMKVVGICSFVPSIIVLMTQSQKGMFLLGIFFFLGGVIVNKHFKNELSLFSKKFLIRTSLIVGIGFPLLAISFISRGLLDKADDSSFLFEKIMDYFVSYAFGHLYCFADWFSFYIGDISQCSYEKMEGYQMGQRTFMTVWKVFLGYKPPSVGDYSEVLVFNDGRSMSNVYTLFRSVIMDWGIIGGLISFVIFGYLSSCFYARFLLKKYDALSITFIIFFVGYTYTSAFISLFAGGSTLILLILTSILLSMNDFFHSNKINIRL